jgi:putative flippase GtrA
MDTLMEQPLQPQTQKAPLKKTFLRSQVVSLTATSVDFSISLALHGLLDVYYVTATSLGSSFGAVTSFVLGRNWAFKNKKGKLRKQAFRFSIIHLFTIFVNSTAVFFFKENFHISFVASRVIVALVVGMFFNFLINRYFVFR